MAQQDDAYDVWFRKEVQKGLNDLKADRKISHEEMKASLRLLGAKLDTEESETDGHVRHKRCV